MAANLSSSEERRAQRLASLANNIGLTECDELQIQLEPREIVRTKESKIYTRRGTKTYKVVYTKGRIIDGVNIEPFGYCNNTP